MNDLPSTTHRPHPKSVALRALRLDMRSMLSIGALFVVVLLTWCIAEYATSVFRSNIENELRTVTASDISVSSRTFPSDVDRKDLRSLAAKYQANFTESVIFPYTLEIPAPSESLSWSTFFTTEVRIVDNSYPLYGKIESSGSLADDALVDGDLYEKLQQSWFFVSGKNISIGWQLLKAPWLSQNPFSSNRNIIVPERLLPFETVTATGAGFRVEYRMDFSVSPENHKSFLSALEARFGKNATPSYRIREQRGEGGNFSDIASTLNDFLGSILYASTLIALSSFLVAISRFALERRKNVKTLIWLGLPEWRFVRVVFLRLLAFFGTLGLLCWGVFALLPEVSFSLLIKGFVFLALGLTIGFWTISEILLRDTRTFLVHKKSIRVGFGGILIGLLSSYLLLSGESYRPILYALASLVLLERFSWGFFFLVSKFFSKSKHISKARFFLLDALRSFRNAPMLGKISFSVFFLLSATLSAVFIFSLAFRDALKITADSRVNTFVNNLLPKDFDQLSNWIAPEEFYSTMRARIVTINGISLSEHLKTTEVSREFSREFSITDTLTNDRTISGKSVSSGKEVSVDQDFAQRLGLQLQDTIEFSLAGRNFEFRVVGIRESKRSGTSPFFYFQIPKSGRRDRCPDDHTSIRMSLHFLQISTDQPAPAAARS